MNFLRNELFKRQRLCKWMLISLAGKKKYHRDAVAHTDTKKSYCDSAELFSLLKKYHVTFYFSIIKVVKLQKSYLFAELF